MTRCIEKTKTGKRCKKTASHNGKCSSHSPSPPPPPASPEIKWCGHMGCHLWDKLCCHCADKRPHTATYFKFVDGYGDLPIGARDDGYCYVCKSPESRGRMDQNLYFMDVYAQTFESVAGILSTYTQPELWRVLGCARDMKLSKAE